MFLSIFLFSPPSPPPFHPEHFFFCFFRSLLSLFFWSKLPLDHLSTIRTNSVLVGTTFSFPSKTSSSRFLLRHYLRRPSIITIVVFLLLEHQLRARPPLPPRPRGAPVVPVLFPCALAVSGSRGKPPPPRHQLSFICWKKSAVKFEPGACEERLNEQVVAGRMPVLLLWASQLHRLSLGCRETTPQRGCPRMLE